MARMERKECVRVGCGVKFTSPYPWKKYCCAECANIVYFGTWDKSQRNCLACEEPFKPNRVNHVYCSRRCQMMNYNIIHDVKGVLKEKYAARRKLRASGEV